jgi:predicted GNAT family acetyltransferase
MNWQFDLISGMETGDLSDKNSIYVKLHYYSLMNYHEITSLIDPIMFLTQSNHERVLLLQTIYIPEQNRGNGIASKIIDFLINRAKRENIKFAIGPILADENNYSILWKMCIKRGYKQIHPFSFLVE